MAEGPVIGPGNIPGLCSNSCQTHDGNRVKLPDQRGMTPG